jgi:hypothetical protein
VPSPRKRKGRDQGDPLAAYKRIRKPMPPPGQVMPDKRRKVQERGAQREEREAESEERDAGREEP